MGLKISVNAKPVIDKFTKLMNHMADTKQDFIRIKPMLIKEINANITIQRNPNGKKWRSLSPNYLASEEYAKRPRLSPEPLDTDNYRRNFNMIADSRGLSIIPLSPYTFEHEQGTGGMPKRSAVWFSNRFLERLTNEFSESFLRDLR